MKNIPNYTGFKESVNEAKFSKDDRVRTTGGVDFGDETFTVISQKGNNVTVEDDEDEIQIFKASKLELAESVTEGGGYTKVQDELEELIKNMPKRAYDGFAGEYDIDPEDAAEMMGFITDIPDKDAKRVIKDIKKGLYESVYEAMAYKKAQKFTKKLNDDALLKDLIYVANKIHDKMGTNDDVQEWLKTVITYGNKQPQMWSE